MIKVVSVKNATIGDFDAVHYHAQERGLVGVTPSGAGVNLMRCKLPDAQNIVQGIYSQIGKKEGVIDLDPMVPQPTNGTTTNGHT